MQTKEQTDHRLYYRQGIDAFKSGNLKQACQFVETAANIAPKVALYHRSLAELLRQRGQLHGSIATARRAIELEPSDADAHYNLGLAQADNGETEAAKMAYRRATQLNPQHTLAWNNLGALLEAEGCKEDALEIYRLACRIDPSHAEAQNNAGAILLEMGEFDPARAHLNAAIAARPGFAEAHQNLSELKTYAVDDPHLLEMERLALAQPPASPSVQTRLFFALGKARADVGYVQGAFAAYAQGNRLHRAQQEPFEPRSDQLHRAMAKAFSQGRMNSASKYGESSEVPIFVVGMPRSGTSLIEQIIASHPDAFGAGELTDFHIVAQDVLSGSDFAQIDKWIDKVPEDVWETIGKRYLKCLRRYAPKARRIVDKMPGNHLLAGMIHCALPNAKIIHTMRDPMDSCWSNYTRLFSSTMNFAYDLEELGRQYQRYKTLMQHWVGTLPETALLHVQYERVVEDFEPEVRRLLDHVELNFDPACLAFHNTKRIVKTASFAQVRKPLYQSSVGRWRAYEPYLAPLRNCVGPEYPHGFKTH